MSKLTIFIVMAAVACVYADDFFKNSDFFKDMESSFGSLSEPQSPQLPQPVMSAESIKNIESDPNSNFQSSYSSRSSSSKTVDGKVVEQDSKGHDVSNDNGRIQEFKY